MNSHIVYVSIARLPTEKAHGFAVMKMCEAIAALGHDVELFHPWRRQADPELAATDAFAYYGIERTFRVVTLPNWDIVVPLERRLPELAIRVLFGAHQLAWAFLAARRAVRVRPDLVYTRTASVAYWATLLGCPCIFETHAPPGRREARLVRRFARRTTTRVVITLTASTAAALEAAGVPAEKIEVLPSGIDLAAFADAPSKRAARELLELPCDRPIVGYVGRFETMKAEKGVGDLIRAVGADVVRERDPLLVCVGGPLDRAEEYRRLAASAGVPESSLRLVDRVPNGEVPTWLAALDFAALPAPAGAARYEGATSPMKLFEYMAAGLPIVAADMPGVREVLDDGEVGLLVPPGDHEALARGLERLLDDPGLAERLAANARREAARYTWARRAERALEAARSVQPPSASNARR